MQAMQFSVLEHGVEELMYSNVWMTRLHIRGVSFVIQAFFVVDEIWWGLLSASGSWEYVKQIYFNFDDSKNEGYIHFNLRTRQTKRDSYLIIWNTENNSLR